MSEMKKVFEELTPENQNIILMTAKGMKIAEDEMRKKLEKEKVHAGTN